MIKLDTAFITGIVSTMGGATTTVTTDTLFVSCVRMDFTTGALYATIKRGTGTPFVPNMDDLDICVNPDGSFVSTDSSWTGSVVSVPALVAQLKAEFDQFILASGKVTGTAE
ncbi:MAG TPA: hypothetical protein VKR59_07915 [Terriglobales bacterium]|nr:hypothetical protein [Terriglobales bacterium]